MAVGPPPCPTPSDGLQQLSKRVKYCILVSAQPERVPRRPRRPRALPLGVGALRAPLGAAGVRVAVRRHPRLAAPPVAARGHGRVAREAVAVGANRLVAIERRRDWPLGRMEWVERAERTLVR
uniref:Uncharacterized protein n=1 Tax=Emiliania huxleyi TaxID=2903 RepID=A0A7S3TR94_EMIHU